MKAKTKQEKRQIRHKRARARIFGAEEAPRLCVFRSNNHIYAQLINDEKGTTILSASDLELKKRKVKTKSTNKKQTEGKAARSGKILTAFEVGKLLAEKAAEKKIKKVIFDRGGYQYHGRVKALAEGAREAGLVF